MLYHALNILFHALNSVLLIAWLRSSRLPATAALLGGQIFAVHPANVEAEAWMSQIKTNAMNDIRSAKTKGPTKSWLRTEAWSEVVEEITSGQHQDCVGNKPALEALVTRRMEEIEARMKAAEPVVVATDDEG